MKGSKLEAFFNSTATLMTKNLQDLALLSIEDYKNMIIDTSKGGFEIKIIKTYNRYFLWIVVMIVVTIVNMWLDYLFKMVLYFCFGKQYLFIDIFF